MEKYNWKRSWEAKGLSPEEAIETLEIIKKEYGSITPENVLDYAKNPKTSIHKLFEWDDKKAAHQHRLQQARLFINNIQITIISDGEPREIGAYEIVRNNENENEYKNITTFTQSDIEYTKENILNSLKQISIKLKIYRQFHKIQFEVDQLIKKLEETEV